VSRPVHLLGGVQEADELVEVKCAAATAALLRFAGALAAGGVALDPVRVFGLIEDLRERAERLVDRFIAEAGTARRLSMFLAKTKTSANRLATFASRSLHAGRYDLLD
jgi:hypothetical protein